FGATVLKDRACREMRVTLHDMKFPIAKRNVEPMTAAQATAIRVKAHERGQQSVALAQAIQFECGLRQKEVIGEWVPIEEPGPLSDIHNDGMKWVRGLRWTDLDDDLCLKRPAAKIDLKKMPMVIEEFGLIYGGATREHLPVSGPMIMHPEGLPWVNYRFRH